MIQLSDLMPATFNCARNIAKIHPGDNVLIMTDTTTDPDVITAYKIAYESCGGVVTVITVKCEAVGSNPHDITDKLLTGLFPKVAVEAMKAADFYIDLTCYTDQHGIYGTGHSTYGLMRGDLWEKYHTRMLNIAIAFKEGLASDWGTYPDPLLKYITYRANQQVIEAANGDMENSVIRVTDPEGTDITVHGFAMYRTAPKPEDIPEYPALMTFGSGQVGLLPQRPTPNMEGVIVSSSIHPGHVPTVKATVKGGRVVKLEGGGEIERLWTQDWEKHKDADCSGRSSMFGEVPGPGINWIEELMYGTHPKAFRIGLKYRYEGSHTFVTWNGGTRRSGTLHFGIGGGKDETYRHRDLEVYFPTFTINGVEMIKNGRLTALDLPDVREKAAEYGDPDLLLAENWIPDLPPVD